MSEELKLAVENAKLRVYAKVFNALTEAGYIEAARRLVVAEFKADFPEEIKK